MLCVLTPSSLNLKPSMCRMILFTITFSILCFLPFPFSLPFHYFHWGRPLLMGITWAVGRLLKKGGGGRFYSRVEKRGGGKVIFSQGGGVVRPPTYSPGHMPIAQHIHLNLFFSNLTTLIVNLRALDRRIDYNQFHI